jgi:hypothetical protein
MNKYSVNYRDENGVCRGKPKVIAASSEQDAITRFKEIEKGDEEFVVEVDLIPRKSGKAKASFWVALLGFLALSGHFSRASKGETHLLEGSFWFLVIAVFSIIMGHKSRGEIKRSSGMVSGNKFAISGLILGYIQLSFWIRQCGYGYY